ncbi:hypothetical protein AAG747_09385 [Rapidithrix thailandica]|uniref:Uncharacterized protein n=1 Tax=Rapidithrix thailandica TaxID=413964 RepID=A0AAW9S2K8_9BACT
MLSEKIKNAIEESEVIRQSVDLKRYGNDWTSFTRTTFNHIARVINAEVSRQILKKPYLLQEFLLFGNDELDSILFTYKLEDISEFKEYLKKRNPQRPHNWISGKTLYSYWHGGNPKSRKINVLLTFLQIEPQLWDKWKKAGLSTVKQQISKDLQLLKQHYLGHYFRYYQKSDNSPVMLKTPFIIREDPWDVVVVEMKTIGHQYRSSAIALRDSALYIDCENLNWDDKESFVFNIGFDPHPEVLVGVSNTLNRRRQTIALKNVLVRQPKVYDFQAAQGLEIPFDADLSIESVDYQILHYFKSNTHNLMMMPYCSHVEELSQLGRYMALTSPGG